METLRCQRAKEQDMEAILDLLAEVFEGEQGIPRALNPIGAEKKPRWRCVKTAAGEIAAVCAVYEEDGAAHMGRIAVKKELRRQGVGRALIRFALEEEFAAQVQEVRMEAREITVAIVKELGGAVIGEAAPFYKGTVTPVRIRKTDFEKATQAK